MKSRKLGRSEFELKGFKVMPKMDNEKPTGKYVIVAGKYPVSEPMTLKNAIETLKSEDFKPGKKIKK